VAQLALGCAVAPRIGSTEGVGAMAGVLDDGEDVVRCPASVVAVTKSQAMMALAWLRRKAAQLV
jgi:hypothetical protein